MNQPKYPKHIYDKVRVKAATQLLQKECIKLLPSLDKTEWQKVCEDVSAWYDGEKSDLMPVHDFWNLADGIMVGSKLKQVVRYFTAENINWNLREVDVAKIDIVWPVGDFEALGKLPYSKDKIDKYLLNHPEEKSKNIKLSDTFEAKYKPREDFPVILVENDQERFTVHDGNRRVLRAILYGKQTISAWSGEYVSGSAPRNYWVSTGYLRQLLYYAQEASDMGDEKTIEAIKSLLGYLFGVSESARINWDLRCREQNDFSRELVS